MDEQFIWLMANQMPRTGPELKKGKIHNVNDYPEGVVDWWIKQGVAKKHISKKSEKDGGK